MSTEKYKKYLEFMIFTKLREIIKHEWRVLVGFLFSLIMLLSFLIFLFYFVYSLLNVKFFYFPFYYLLSIYVILAIFSILIIREFVLYKVLLFPIFGVLYWCENHNIKEVANFLKDYNKDCIKTAVVIVAHFERYNFKYVTKPNYILSDMKVIVKYLKLKRGNDFSFYLNASIDDVYKIMADNNVKEVFFVGHGDSHTFVLDDNTEIFYCEFNNEKYKKDFVHQVHCGTKHGKSLIDYVILKENKDKCFFFRKKVDSKDIKRWFENEIKILCQEKK